MCGGSSRRSYKINTRFDALVHCSECQTSRAMAIKTIQPGMSGNRDEIIYKCTQCGAETPKFAE
jgi:DNA-directed RNA polymerase subunit M/transcription elongation factor TFIIS